MRIHLMAVGGTGMAALAGLLKAQGHEVSGCDGPLYPPMSGLVEGLGIEASLGHDPSHLHPPPDLVVIGNAIHADNTEAAACIERGLPYLSMAEAIGRFAVEGRRSLVVAGTHGKTTTTALCAHLLHVSGMRPNLIVGGIARNFDSSFQWGGGEWTVLEGDEYETAFFDKGPKFLHYRPSVLVLTNIELDHLDNFKDLQQLEHAFVRLFGAVEEGGVILAGTESEPVARLLAFAGRRAVTFGLTGAENLCVHDITYGRDGTRFGARLNGQDLGRFFSPAYGAHNLRNTLAALGACLEAGASLEALRNGLASFEGVARRQEVVSDGDGLVIVDDFAHHPTAIRETLAGLLQRFAPSRVTACFEPRSYTCQTDFHQGALPGAFAAADRVFIGPLKPHEKIPPERRLDLDKVVGALRAAGKEAEPVENPEALLLALKANISKGGLVAFFSSGNYFDLPRRLAAEAAR